MSAPQLHADGEQGGDSDVNKLLCFLLFSRSHWPVSTHPLPQSIRIEMSSTQQNGRKKIKETSGKWLYIYTGIFNQPAIYCTLSDFKTL